jgi:hypothetical protein
MIQMESLKDPTLTIVRISKMNNHETKRTLPTVECEYCGASIPRNVYTRNHGEKCPYNMAKPNHKFCKTCGQERPISEFYAATTKTFDGLASTCKVCILDQTKKRRAEIAV